MANQFGKDDNAVAAEATAKRAELERLLEIKVRDKNPTTRRSLKWYYRAQFNNTGEIPGGLNFDDGRKNSKGRPRSLAPEIERRFAEMVKQSADPSDKDRYLPCEERTVTLFHERLEQEFRQTIKLRQLYTAKNALGLQSYFGKADKSLMKNDTDTQPTHESNPAANDEVSRKMFKIAYKIVDEATQGSRYSSDQKSELALFCYDLLILGKWKDEAQAEAFTKRFQQFMKSI